ncbi:MAG: J domain-containing protein [Pseudomonadota bacterium]
MRDELPGTDDPFVLLAVERDADAKTIRRAYVRLIKKFRPETDPESFKRIQTAYESIREGALTPPSYEEDTPEPDTAVITATDPSDALTPVTRVRERLDQHGKDEALHVLRKLVDADPTDTDLWRLGDELIAPDGREAVSEWWVKALLAGAPVSKEITGTLSPTEAVLVYVHDDIAFDVLERQPPGYERQLLEWEWVQAHCVTNNQARLISTLSEESFRRTALEDPSRDALVWHGAALLAWTHPDVAAGLMQTFPPAAATHHADIDRYELHRQLAAPVSAAAQAGALSDADTRFIRYQMAGRYGEPLLRSVLADVDPHKLASLNELALNHSDAAQHFEEAVSVWMEAYTDEADKDDTGWFLALCDGLNARAEQLGLNSISSQALATAALLGVAFALSDFAAQVPMWKILLHGAGVFGLVFAALVRREKRVYASDLRPLIENHTPLGLTSGELAGWIKENEERIPELDNYIENIREDRGLHLLNQLAHLKSLVKDDRDMTERVRRHLCEQQPSLAPFLEAPTSEALTNSLSQVLGSQASACALFSKVGDEDPVALALFNQWLRTVHGIDDREYHDPGHTVRSEMVLRIKKAARRWQWHWRRLAYYGVRGALLLTLGRSLIAGHFDIAALFLCADIVLSMAHRKRRATRYARLLRLPLWSLVQSIAVSPRHIEALIKGDESVTPAHADIVAAKDDVVLQTGFLLAQIHRKRRSTTNV